MTLVVGQRLIDPKTSPVKILFSLLLFKLVASDTDIFSGFTPFRCVPDYLEKNQTGVVLDPKYETNVESLVNDLITTASSTSLSFYNTTAGKPPHRSYGMYLCRGDATPEICSSCVSNTTTVVLSYNAAANCTDFVALADFCTIRYANYYFFGKANDTNLGWQPGPMSNTISKLYKQTLENAVEQVTGQASYNNTNLFATTEATVDEHEKVYALAQCTPDITREDCNVCLKAAHTNLHNTTGYSKGAWALLPSCQLRYDNASFFGGTATSNPPAPLVIAFTIFIIGLF